MARGRTLDEQGSSIQLATSSWPPSCGCCNQPRVRTGEDNTKSDRSASHSAHASAAPTLVIRRPSLPAQGVLIQRLPVLVHRNGVLGLELRQLCPGLRVVGNKRRRVFLGALAISSAAGFVGGTFCICRPSSVDASSLSPCSTSAAFAFLQERQQWDQIVRGATSSGWSVRSAKTPSITRAICLVTPQHQQNGQE